MWTIFRYAALGAFLYVLYRARQDAASPVSADDLTGAAYLVVAVFVGLITAVLWAPKLGETIADPVTATWTEGEGIDKKYRLLSLSRKALGHGWRRMALCMALVEGVRRPYLPGAFLAGMDAAKSASWLEKIFAREVFRFSNTDHCIRAYKILDRAGETPGVHRSNEVNTIIMSLKHTRPSATPPMNVPPAPPPPPPKRNPRIQLYNEKEGPSSSASEGN